MLKLFAFVLFVFTSRSADLDDDLEEEKSFLELNLQNNPNILETSSGLQYEILQLGDGEKPTVENEVVVKYTGSLLDGTVFDSTDSKGTATFSPEGVIPGWREGLQLMPKGSKFRFWIPARLGYGSRSMSTIPPNSLLMFDVELVDVKEPAPEGFFKEIFLQPIFGPIKLMHVIMFVIYVGMKYYVRSNTSGSSNKAQAKASHILVKSEDEIKAIHKRLKEKGSNVTAADFGEEAKANSTCPSKSSGGSLGWFGTGDMVPAFDKVVFDPKSKLNTVLGPVKTTFGYHLLYIEDRKLPQAPETQETKKSK